MKYSECSYLNYELCIEFYGRETAEYIYNRIEEEFGRNGLDMFLDKVPQIGKDLIREYVVEYMVKKYDPDNLIRSTGVNLIDEE